MIKKDLYRKHHYKNQNGRCFYCGEILDNYFQLDHKMPKCKGGNFTKENLVASCSFCNGSKNGRSVEEYKEVIRERAYKAISLSANEFRKKQFFYMIDRMTDDQRNDVLDAYYNLIETICTAEISFYGERINKED